MDHCSTKMVQATSKPFYFISSIPSDETGAWTTDDQRDIDVSMFEEFSHVYQDLTFDPSENLDIILNHTSNEPTSLETELSTMFSSPSRSPSPPQVSHIPLCEGKHTKCGHAPTVKRVHVHRNTETSTPCKQTRYEFGLSEEHDKTNCLSRHALVSPTQNKKKLKEIPPRMKIKRTTTQSPVEMTVFGNAKRQKSDCSKKSNPAKSQTRKCREKISEQFSNLVDVLYPPHSSNDLKHKGQVLQYTIESIQILMDRRAKMLTGISLSSKDSLQAWIETTITERTRFTTDSKRKTIPSSRPLLFSVLESFLGMYCESSEWIYGELWTRGSCFPGKDSNEMELKKCAITSNNVIVRQNLQHFYEISKQTTSPIAPKQGVLLRAMATGNTEWIDDIGLEDNQFERSALTADHGLKTIQVIPVSSFPNRCEAVIILGDIRSRSFNLSTVQSLKEHVAEILEYCTKRVS